MFLNNLCKVIGFAKELIMGNNYTVINQPQTIQERMNRLPFGIPFMFLCLIGIVGNAFVLHIFRKIRQDSTYKVFVFVLALLDLLSSFAHFWKEAATLVFTSYDDGDIECKLTYFYGVIVGSSSFIVVLAIAVERYRRICHPLMPQMSVSTSKRVCIGCVCVSALTGIPFSFIMGNWYAKVDDLIIVQCLLGNSGEPKIWPFIYCLFYLILSFIFCLFLTFIQCIIWRKIRASKAMRMHLKADGENLTQEKKSESQIESKEGNLKSISATSTSKTFSAQDDIPHIDQFRAHNVDMKESELMKKGPLGAKRLTARVAEEDNVKITLTFCIITFLLIVSYTPHLAFNTYVAYRNYYKPHVTLDRSTYTLFSVLQHFVTINGILNPFVYFFNDKRFRNLLKGTIC